MEIMRFKKTLSELISKTLVNSDDFWLFLKSIFALSKCITDSTTYPAFSQIIKNWMAAFKMIFSKTKIDKSLQKDISKFCKAVTELYFSLLRMFHQYEPSYMQECYFHWKEILSLMSASSRAKNFIRNIIEFKCTIEHLQTAEHRFEQMAILDVLQLYTENVSRDELAKLKLKDRRDYMNVVEKINELGTQASVTKQHTFLNTINSKGGHIITFQPTIVNLINCSLSYTKSKYDMWVDFNLKDDSIVFIAVSLTDEEDQCMAMVSQPLIGDNIFLDEYLMFVSGYWNLLPKSNVIANGATSKIMFTTPIYVQNKILKLKSVFNIEPYNLSYADNDVHQKKNCNKERSDSETTTICFPSIHSTCNSDYDAVPSKKSRKNNESTTTMFWHLGDTSDSDCNKLASPVNDWTYILNDDSDSKMSVPVVENSDPQEKCNENLAVEKSPVDCKTISDQIQHGTLPIAGEKEHQNFKQNDASQLQRMEVDSSVLSPDHSLQKNVPPKIQIRRKSTIISKSRVNICVYETCNGDLNGASSSIMHQSHNFSITKETVDDMMSSTNNLVAQPLPISSQYNNVNESVRDYRRRLRPRVKTYSDNSNDGKIISKTTPKRRNSSAARVTTKINVSRESKPIVNTEPAMFPADVTEDNKQKTQSINHQSQLSSTKHTDNGDLVQQYERCLTSLTEFRTEFSEKFSRIHEECIRFTNQYIERFGDLLN